MTDADLSAEIATALRAGLQVSDEKFDRLLSTRPQSRSGRFWSCVEAAQTAAQFFREAGAQRILDVGSGVGKFCSIASLTLGRRVWGVERRSELVTESRELSRRLTADVVIAEGTLEGVDASAFDGFYCFNPFAEYVADHDDERYDASFPQSFALYVSDARRIERWLRAAPVGTAMVTYNGLGGRIPSSYSVRRATFVRDDAMRLWVKEREHDVDGEAMLEVEGELVKASRLLALARGSGADLETSPLVAALCRSERDADAE
jgi:SAM-dependent methyltransferase